MDWIAIFEKGIIGALTGLMVYMFVKVVNWLRTKRSDSEEQVQKRGNHLLNSRVKTTYPRPKRNPNEENLLQDGVGNQLKNEQTEEIGPIHLIPIFVFPILALIFLLLYNE